MDIRVHHWEEKATAKHSLAKFVAPQLIEVSARLELKKLVTVHIQ